MIVARGLHHRYPSGQQALNGVDLSIEKGELVALLGPNGAGKSTLLRLLAGMPCQQGSVLLEGNELSRLDRRQAARKIAFVAQQSVFSFPFRVREVVMMGRFARLDRLGLREGEHREPVERALEWTGLVPLSERRVTELSGGEAQRVRLAQALAQEPEVLLLDEPTTHLDVHLQLELLELVSRLNRETHLTVMLSLHDLNLALRYAKRLVVMKSGRIALQGSPHEVSEDNELSRIFAVEFARWIAPDQSPRLFPLSSLKPVQVSD